MAKSLPNRWHNHIRTVISHLLAPTPFMGPIQDDSSETWVHGSPSHCIHTHLTLRPFKGFLQTLLQSDYRTEALQLQTALPREVHLLWYQFNTKQLTFFIFISSESEPLYHLQLFSMLVLY